MKQHIDTTQLSQLNDKGKERLQNWFLENKQEYIDQKKKDIKSSTTATEMFIHHDLLMDDLESLQFSDAYLLSIGQMIEFLGDDWHVAIFKSTIEEVQIEDKYLYQKNYSLIETKELCDALWEACLEILNRE